jgi:hypothetical protein
MRMIQSRKVRWDRRGIHRRCGWRREGIEDRRRWLVIQREGRYMLVVVIVMMSMSCVKLMRANSYGMLMVVLVVEQKAGGDRGHIRHIPVKGVRPIIVHLVG